MPKRISNWFDQRTGYRKIVEALLIEHIPGGARWRYVWGSCLAIVFSLQLVTGLLLMMAYSPSDSTAWASVFYIQYMMDFGWLIRGLHHFGSQTMVVLLGVHMLQVVIAGAHLPPREVNWWLGLALLGAVLALSLTGYLLPWDQKGYWATQVATNIVGNLPGLGPAIQKIIVGGPVYGHHTLTRFFALHVAILPPLIVVLMIAHIAVFRRHGVTTPRDAQGEGWFWPDQAFRDMLASLVIFGVMLAMVLWGHGHSLADAGSSTLEQTAAPSGMWEKVKHWGRWGKGANLDAPADPSRPYPARPEWYFLFLFQLLKYFPGEEEVIGTVVIPGVAGLVLILIPLLGHLSRKLAHIVGCALISSMLLGIGTLTILAIAADNANTAEANFLRVEKERAEALGERAIQLAARGVPPDGAVHLLRRDPMTQGGPLFGEHCAGCHSYRGRFDAGEKASDLAGFGTKEWIRDLLSDPASPRFFGHTRFRLMDKWAKGDGKQVPDEELQLIAEWLSTHPQGTPQEGDTSLFARGYEHFMDRCNNCHTYEPEPDEYPVEDPGPDLTGYGSAEWLRLMLMSPDHERRYGERNAMPVFRDLEGASGAVAREDFGRGQQLLLSRISGTDEASEKRRERIRQTQLSHLSDLERELIIRWLTGDDRVVFGGEPIGASPK